MRSIRQVENECGELDGFAVRPCEPAQQVQGSYGSISRGAGHGSRAGRSPYARVEVALARAVELVCRGERWDLATKLAAELTARGKGSIWLRALAELP